MNAKGLYTGIIGILAVVLISAALIFSGIPSGEGKINVQSKAVQQLNLKMLNEYGLFDNAVVMGAYDSFSGCNWNGDATTINTIRSYVIAADARIPECNIDNASISTSGGPSVQISFPVTCSVRNESGTTLASITKNFRFNVSGDAPGDPCSPRVLDLYASSTQVYP